MLVFLLGITASFASDADSMQMNDENNDVLSANGIAEEIETNAEIQDEVLSANDDAGDVQSDMESHEDVLQAESNNESDLQSHNGGIISTEGNLAEIDSETNSEIIGAENGGDTLSEGAGNFQDFYNDVKPLIVANRHDIVLDRDYINTDHYKDPSSGSAIIYAKDYSFTIDGNGHTLDFCKFGSGFRIIRSGNYNYHLSPINVTFKNINFKNYTSTIMILGDNPGFGPINLKVINCTFTNDKMEKSTSSTGVIRILDVRDECSILIKDCNFTNGNANSIPFLSEGSNLHITLDNCSFANFYSNAASSSLYRGGLIVNWGSSKEFNVYNCKFVNMTTLSSVTQNDQAQSGGVVFLTVGNPVIRFVNSSFVNCSTIRGNGGSIYVGPTPGSGGSKVFNFDITVDNCSFVNSSAGRHGGAIYVGGYSGRSNDFQASVRYNFTLSITNSSFINNTAKNGGALCVDAPWIGLNGSYQGHSYDARTNVNVSVDIRDNCLFEGNTANCQNGANTGGGAIYIGYSPGNTVAADRIKYYDIDVSISNNCSFVRNSASVTGSRNSGGGAIYVFTHSDVNISNCSFEENSVKVTSSSYYTTDTGGGAIFVGKPNDENEELISTLSIEDTSFTNNGATGGLASGGAVYVKDVSSNNLNNVTFEGNSIEGKYGTAVYFEGASENNVVNVTFQNNTGSKNALGGALSFGANTTNNIENCSFINNTLTSSNGAGGAVYYRDGSGQGNNTYVNVNFEGNSANSGGAVYIGSGWQDIEFKDSNFTSNSATNGGAFYLNNSSAILNNSTFEENSAGKNGGAVYLNDCAMTVEDSDFSNNNANKSGGAFYVNNGHLGVNSSDFENNSANKSGGAIYLYENNTATIDNTNFNNNSANYLGGAVFVGVGTNTTIDHANFTNNSAFEGSAINYQAETGVTSNNTISNSQFYDNLADSTDLIASLDKTTDTLDITYFSGDNYLNGIKSYDDLEFNNVSYYEYGQGNKNTDEGDYVKSYQVPNQKITVEYLDANGNVIYTEVLTTDDLGRASTVISVPGAVSVRAYREGDSYYTPISTDISRALGDFELMQRKILATSPGATLEFDRDYIYTIGLDSITEGIEIDRPITIDGKGFSIDALYKSRIFRVLSDNVTFVNLTFYNSTRWDGSFVYGVGVSNINITDCTFDNSASFEELQNPKPKTLDEDDDRIRIPTEMFNGCAVYLVGNNSMTVNSTFTHLLAYNGGGMYINGTNHVVSNCSFDNVEAKQRGAAIFALGEQFSIDAQFVNATAGIAGGAIYAIVNGFDLRGNFTNCTGGVNASNITNVDEYLVSSIIAGKMNNTQIGGGAVYFGGHGANIVGSNFVNCTSSTLGGALHIDAENVNIGDSNFTNCSALSGGALAVDILSFGVNIDKCIFENNSAFNNGGAASIYGETVSLSNSKFDSNIQILNPNEMNGGGAIYWFGSQGTLYGCNFTQNCVTFPINNPKYDPYGHYEIIWYYDWGEYVWIEPNFIRYVENFDINNETMVNQLFSKYSSGGAILIRGVQIDMGNCIFDDNFAQSGGAIAIYEDVYGRTAYSSPNINIVYSNFTNNFAQLGGAILSYTNHNAISRCEFTNNSAYVGGAVSLQGNDSYIEFSTFTHNGAVYGGALAVGETAHEETVGYWSGRDWIEFTDVFFNGRQTRLFNSTFIDNGGLYGGAVLWLGQDGIIDEVCHFINNSYDKGYDYYLEGFKRCYVMNITLDDVNAMKYDPNGAFNTNFLPEFYEYLVEGYGGAVYWAGTNGAINNAEFTNNSAPNAGAVFVYPIGERVVPMISTDPNMVFHSNAEILYVNFTGNTAEMGSGGAVAFIASDGNIEHCQFVDNHAVWNDAYNVQPIFSESRGGAVLWCGYVGGISESEFINNTAEYSGGAVSWSVLPQSPYTSSDGYMFHVAFINNTAEIGGAFHNEGENMYFDEGFTFINNTAAAGGAIFNEGDYLTVHGAEFMYNNASMYGGAIYNTGKELGIAGSLFVYNRAETGSAIYTSGYIALEDSSLGYNQAKAALLKITSYTSNGTGANISTIFKGNDNLMNAIYTQNGYDVYNVFYWGADGPTNSNDVWPSLSDLEAGMNITFILTSIEDPDAQYTGVAVTNIDGEATFTVNGVIPGRYIVEAIHYEDDYYTQEDAVKIITIGKIPPTIRITSDDIFYKENETVKVQLNKDVTGNVTISIDGIINLTVNMTKGIAVMENVSGLIAGIHNVTVYYPGDLVYSNASASTRFVVKQLPSTINITTFNETFDAKVPFKVILGTNDDMTGTIFITVEDQFGVTFTVNATNEFEGVIFGLPNGKYNVTAYYAGDNNYMYSSNFTSFNITNAGIVPIVMDVSVADIVYLENATAHIKVSGGRNGTVTITVDNKTFTGNVTNGTGVIVLTGLSAGVKTADANFTDAENGTKLSSTARFVVEKLPTAVDVNVNGKSVTVNVTEGAKGNLTVYINSVKYVFDYNGTPIVFDDVLNIGNNTIFAIYDGNENYTESRNTTYASVAKKEAKINVTAKDIVYGEDAEITVTVGTGQTGHVTITVNNQNYTAGIIGDTAKFAVHGLNVDKYNVTAVYLGDHDFDVATNNTTFAVSKANLTAAVIGENVTVYRNASFVISGVPSDFQGQVNITVDGITYSGSPDLLIHMAKLTAGNKTATATFYGDPNYNDLTVNTTFTVSRAGVTEMTVVVADVDYRNNAFADISVSGNANGTAVLNVNGKVYDGIAVVNGSARVDLGILSAGIKNVTAEFTVTDLINNNATAVTKFVVNKAPSDVSIAVSGRDVTVSVADANSGNITVYVNGIKYEREFIGQDIVINDALITGNNTIVAIYGGNENYTESRNTTYASVAKKDATVNVTAEEITYGDDAEIIVTVGAGQTGYVTITVNGNEYTSPINGTKAVFAVPRLNVSNYTVNVTYSGDVDYSVAVNNTTLVVKKANLTAVVVGENITVHDNSIFILRGLPSDFHGQVNITVDNVTYVGEPDLVIKMAKLTAGDKIANATFYGDSNYNDLTVTAPFTVSAISPSATVVTVDVNDVVYGENATALISVSGNANGTVRLTVNGKTYDAVNVVNGTASLDLGILSAGVKDVLANFTVTDDVNSNATGSTKFDVDKAPSAVDIIVAGGNVTVDVINGTSGNLTIYIGGIKYEREFAGQPVEIDDILVTGNNTIIAIYSGNENYTGSQKSKEVFIPKETAKVNVTAEAIVYGDEAEIIVTVGAGQTGYVTIEVNGREYAAPIRGTQAVFLVPGLKVANYTVNVTYSGDVDYSVAVNNTTLVVKKANLTAIVIGENVTVKDNSSFILSGLPSDFHGQVNITVDNVTYSGSPDIIIRMAKLTAGEKTATATFYGDPNYNDLTVNTTFTVLRVGVTEMVVSVNDVTYGENATAVISVSGNANGTVRLTVNGKVYDGIAVVNGSASVDLGILSAGIKNVTAEFTVTDDVNANATAAAKFVVNKAPSAVNITVDGKNVTVNVINGTSGNLTVYINGIKYEKEFTGQAVVFNDVLINGNNTVVAIYSGNENYTGSQNDKNASVAKQVSTVNVTAEDITYGEDAEITVAVGAGQTGYVTIMVNNNEYTAEIKNGGAKFLVPGLNVAKYNVTVTYSGDNSFDVAVNNTTFTVNKANITATVTGQNVTVNDNSLFVIDGVPSDFNGMVNITVDGITYSGAPSSLIRMDKLTAGEKTATATFYGDPNYNDLTVNTTFTVSRAGLAEMTVNVSDVTYGENATAFISVSGNANGTVKVTVNGKTYDEVKVVNGTATVNLGILSAGIKNVTAEFTVTDDVNTNASATTKFNVAKANSTVKINVTGSNVTVTVTPGETGNLKVYINGNEYNFTYSGPVTIKNALGSERNSIVAVYEGSENYTGSQDFKTAVIPRTESLVNVTADDITYGSPAIIVVNVPLAQTGYATITVDGKKYTSIIKNGEALFNVTGLKVDNYTVEVTYEGSVTYDSQVNKTTFTVSKADLPETVIAQNVTVKDNASFVVSVPDDFTGKVRITVDGKTYVGDAEALIIMDKLSAGDKVAKVEFFDDPNYNNVTVDVPFKVNDAVTSDSIRTVKADDMTRGWNSEFDYQAAFLNKDGSALKNTEVQFKVNGKTYNAKTNDDGIAHLTTSKLDVGTYKVTAINLKTGEQATRTAKIVKRLIENKDITLEFVDGTYYTVKAIGDDGKPVGAGEVVGIRVNGRDYNAITDANGVARLKINLNPKKYTLTAKYAGYKVTNKVVVKQTLKLVKKTVTVKKSAKSFKLKATLKWASGKAIKGKKIVFKFKGKKYTTKTNSKGLAQVTIKKSVIKKLKKGKTYKFSAKYITNFVYGKVKVSK